MRLEEGVAAVRAENVALREQVQALLARVQELEAKQAKDSHKRSKPPSTDGPTRMPRTAPQQEVATWMSSQDSWLKESGSRLGRSAWTSPRPTSAGRTTWKLPLPTAGSSRLPWRPSASASPAATASPTSATSPSTTAPT